MALTAVLNSLEGISDEIKSHYRQEDGKFVLDVTAAEGLRLENASSLRSALEEERQRVTDLKASVKSFDGVDEAWITKARDALGRLEDMKNWTPEEKVKQQIDERVNDVTTKYEEKLLEANNGLSSVTGQLEKVLVDDAIRKAVGDKGDADLLLPHVRPSVRMQRLDSGEYAAKVVKDDGKTVRISKKGSGATEMAIDELIEEMSGEQRFKRLFNGSDASGGGATGGDLGAASDPNFQNLPPAERLKQFRAKQGAGAG